MKALLLTDYRQLEVADVPVPTCDDDSVLVRVAACGICGSDVHGFDGSSGRRIPPLVMGHEAAGTVMSVGANIVDLQSGDRVTFDSTIFCGTCEFCQSGQVNLCQQRQVLGVSCGEYVRFGAFAEFVVVPRRVVHVLPSSLSLENAALTEPVSVALHAVRRSSITADDTVLVIGTGMIGLLVIQVLKTLGPKSIIAVDQDEGRLTLARQCGADTTIPAAAEDMAKELAAATDGQGVDVVLEAVGISSTIWMGIECVSKGGRVVLIGNVSPTVTIPLQAVVTREVSLIGTCASSGEYPECLRLMAEGQVDVAPLISACAPLEEGPQWFERLYHREPGLLKVLLQP